MSLLGHAAAGVINTWGFAYVGGIIGLFSVSLLYVKGKVDERPSTSRRSPKRSRLAALGPGVIVVGGLCGVSFGLGVASALERQFVDDIDVSDVVSRLCASDPGKLVETDALHDDIEHVVDDLDLVSASGVHSDLHDERSPADRELLVDRLVAELSTGNENRVGSCDEAVDDDTRPS